MIYEADEQLGAILLKHGLNDVSDADYKRSGKFRFGKTANSSPYVIFDYINIHVGSRSSYKSLGPRIDGDVVATMLYFLTAKKADRVAVFLKDEYDHERALTTIESWEKEIAYFEEQGLNRPRLIEQKRRVSEFHQITF